jgi:hypothetical protein
MVSRPLAYAILALITTMTGSASCVKSPVSDRHLHPGTPNSVPPRLRALMLETSIMEKSEKTNMVSPVCCPGSRRPWRQDSHCQ